MDVSVRPKKTKKAQTPAVERPFKRPRQQSFAKQIGAVGSFSPEKKNQDVTGAPASVGTAWSALTLLNPIVQGTGVNGRIGRRLNMVAFHIRATVTTSSAAGNARWMVVYDHAPNGALPAITDILVVDNINSPTNLNNNDRFMILHDELINAPGFSTQIIATKWFRKFPQGLQSIWTNAATGTIADITSGAVYVMCVGSAATTFTFYSRIRYIDN